MSFPVSVVDMLAASLLRDVLERPSKLPFLRFCFYVDECFVCMCVCMYTTWVPDALGGGQKRASDPLELAFQTHASYHVGAGNQVPLL